MDINKIISSMEIEEVMQYNKMAKAIIPAVLKECSEYADLFRDWYKENAIENIVMKSFLMEEYLKNGFTREEAVLFMLNSTVSLENACERFNQSMSKVNK